MPSPLTGYSCSEWRWVLRSAQASWERARGQCRLSSMHPAESQYTHTSLTQMRLFRLSTDERREGNCKSVGDSTHFTLGEHQAWSGGDGRARSLLTDLRCEDPATLSGIQPLENKNSIFMQQTPTGEPNTSSTLSSSDTGGKF